MNVYKCEPVSSEAHGVLLVAANSPEEVIDLFLDRELVSAATNVYATEYTYYHAMYDEVEYPELVDNLIYDGDDPHIIIDSIYTE
jgi:hypothetical protein